MAEQQRPHLQPDPAWALEASKVQVDIWWRQYDRWITLYRGYLDLLLRLNLFFYAITGGIVSYVLSHQKDGDGAVRYALWLPILMSAALGVFAIYAARLTPVMRSDVFALRDLLRLSTAPDVHVLTVLLSIFAAIFVLVATGLTWLFFRIAPS